MNFVDDSEDLLMVSLKAFSTFLKKKVLHRTSLIQSYCIKFVDGFLHFYFYTNLPKKVLRGSPTPEMTWHRAQRAMPGGESEVVDHDDGQHHGDDHDD